MRPTYEIYKALLDSWQPERDNFGRIQNASPSYVKDIHKVVFEEIEFFTKDFGKVRENFGIEVWRTLLSTLDLKTVYLAFKKLEGADLEGAKLEGADLEGANLEGAKLAFANLTGANLTFADLTLANLTRTNLKGARLAGAIFTFAKYSPVTKFPDGFDPEAHKMILVDDDEKNANPDFRG